MKKLITFYPYRLAINLLTATMIVIVTASCANKYSFKKRVDVFMPHPDQTFYVTPTYTGNFKADQYAIPIEKKIKEKLLTVPLSYTSKGDSDYTVNFSYRDERLLHTYLFRLDIVHNSSSTHQANRLVYSAEVLSHNKNLLDSIAAALKIFLDNIVDLKYQHQSSITLNATTLIKKVKVSPPVHAASRVRTEHYGYHLYSVRPQSYNNIKD